MSFATHLHNAYIRCEHIFARSDGLYFKKFNILAFFSHTPIVSFHKTIDYPLITAEGPVHLHMVSQRCLFVCFFARNLCLSSSD